ncbi:MAG: hypothetical protein WD397_11410 [Wenzhouxiangellaceae bacterium]
MSRRIEAIEKQVQELSPKELAAFRKWFVRYDAAAWVLQFEADAQTGRLDKPAKDALADHEAGRSSEL